MSKSKEKEKPAPQPPPAPAVETDLEGETGLSVLAKALGPQMASELIYLMRGRIDQRKLAVLSQSVQASMGHFQYRAKVDKIRYFDWIVDWELNSSVSIGGLGRRQIIQTLEASAGVAVPLVEPQPNILARNIWRRSWKARAIREGKIPVE